MGAHPRDSLEQAGRDYVAAEEAATRAAADSVPGSAAFEAALEASRTARAAYARALIAHGQEVPSGLVSASEMSSFPADGRRSVTEADFAWADQDQIGLCLTAVESGSAIKVLRALEAEGKSAITTFADSETVGVWRDGALDAGLQPVWAFDHEGWTWVVEPNGFLGSRPETARLVGATGAYVSVYWNVNALSSFLYVVGGEVVREFEMLFAEQEVGGHHGQRLAQEADLDWEGSSWSAGLALQSRLSGFSWSGMDDLEELAEHGFTYEL